jgi:hypothetical protein
VLDQVELVDDAKNLLPPWGRGSAETGDLLPAAVIEGHTTVSTGLIASLL